jgi:hypothetical protein
MLTDRQKLSRLLRLERVRRVAKATAAVEAARAEGTLAQLRALAARSDDLAAQYAERTDARDGDDLRRIAIFANGLQAVRSSTLADAARAQSLADLRQSELAAAERRRAAVADRASAKARKVVIGGQNPALGARRK